MMGVKPRSFAPITNVSLENLVPRDHFYRQLERSLDLAFVRELVLPCYAAGGRPSVDPVVFFKLQLGPNLATLSPGACDTKSRTYLL